MLKRRPRVKKEAVLRAVSTLVLSDGRMERTAFAARIGELPTRVDGAVSRLSEVLNADGYPVLRLERAEGQVVLDLALLRQTFALEG